jgi:hypothetical protein
MLMKHKNPTDLVHGDKFAMAGMHYEVLEVYETVDPEITKVAFWLNSEAPFSRRRLTMNLQNDIIITTL